MIEILTRQCGMVHEEEGVVCTKNVQYQKGCCADTIYNHTGPHERIHDGKITHRWEVEYVVTDLPFDGYMPWEEGDDAS